MCQLISIKLEKKISTYFTLFQQGRKGTKRSWSRCDEIMEDQEPVMMGKLEYLLLQAHQQQLEQMKLLLLHCQMLLEICARKFQMNHGGKLPHTLSILNKNYSLFVKISLIQVREWMYFFSNFPRQQTSTYQLGNY